MKHSLMMIWRYNRLVAIGIAARRPSPLARRATLAQKPKTHA
jgi:hypothetical protein